MKTKLDSKLINKLNYMSSKIDVVNSLTNLLIDNLSLSENITKKDFANLAHVLQSRIKDLKIKYEDIIRELKI
ncbi:hypothetical protein IJ843_03915 [bacterium]|nr:hypothetical protein [bacterium]